MNRSLAAKHALAKLQNIEAANLENSKPFYSNPDRHALAEIAAAYTGHVRKANKPRDLRVAKFAPYRSSSTLAQRCATPAGQFILIRSR